MKVFFKNSDNEIEVIYCTEIKIFGDHLTVYDVERNFHRIKVVDYIKMEIV